MPAERMDTLAAWPPEATRVLRSAERIAFSTLKLALPGYMILARRLAFAKDADTPLASQTGSGANQVGLAGLRVFNLIDGGTVNFNGGVRKLQLNNVDFAAIAPILCAGVTVYKGLKETDAKPGQWVVISGVGGLGHLAVQYAKAMGFHVAAIALTDGGETYPGVNMENASYGLSLCAETVATARWTLAGSARWISCASGCSQRSHS